MELSDIVLILLTVALTKDLSMGVQFTTSPDYVYANTTLNMTCTRNESIVNSTATFYRQSNIILGTVWYSNNNCFSSTTWSYDCNWWSNSIVVSYIPTSTPSTNETYHCRFEGGIGNYAASDIITVRNAVSASSVDLSPPNTTYNVTEGQTLNTVTCSAPTCWPLCTFKWTGPNKDIVGNELEISNINTIDDGLYQCHATNLVETVISSSVTVNVLYGPTNTTISPSTSRYIKTEGGYIETITCSSSCNPACNYQWINPEGEISNSRFLSKWSLKRSHHGNFTCRINNSIAVDTISVSITVNYGPTDTSISPSTNEYTRAEGDNVGPITCSASCRPTCSYQWLYPNGETSNSKILSISPVSREHHGTFTCTTKNSIGVDTVILEIIVNYGPTYINISPPTGQYTKTEGNTIGAITCSSPCRPSCSYQWIYPDGKTNNGGNLYISSLERSHHGKFTCRANNTIGDYSISINVIVNYGPNDTSISPPTDDYTRAEGDNVGPITCSASCRPTCSYQWLYPNGETSNSKILFISSVKREHHGTFTCTTHNSIGVDTVTLKIHVNYGPTDISISPSTRQYTKIEGNAIGTIACSSPCRPSCSYQWIYPDGKTNNGGNLYISSLGRSHHGTFTCTANNTIGEDMISISVIVNYMPGDVTLSPPTTAYTLIEHSSLEIICTADCRPDCTYDWSGPVPFSDKRLFIASVKRTNRGTYTCRARNGFGNVPSSSVQVIISTLPTKVEKITLKCISATQAVITWLPDFTVVPGQNFTLNYKPKDGKLQNATFNEANDQEDIYVLHVDNLRPTTEYIFTISSENYVGRRVSDEVSCITAVDNTPVSTLNGALIGGIVMVSIAVLLIAIVVTFVVTQRCRNSGDETEGTPKCTGFINECLSRIPGRKRKSSNHYENTCQQSPYENLSRDTGNKSEDGQVEKHSNNVYEELQTRNTTKTTENHEDKSTFTVAGNTKHNQRTSGTYVNYENVAKRKKPKPPKKPAKIQQTKT